MTRDELIERMAEAIFLSDYDNTLLRYDTQPEHAKTFHRRRARAALDSFTTEEYLSAVRPGWVAVPEKPTPEMVRAGRQSLRNGGLLPAYTDKGDGGQTSILQYLLEPCWQNMLAARPEETSDG